MMIKPEVIFTPRAPQINKEMYVDRPEIEARLSLAVLGDKVIIIYGESGNGKTWLYKKVFDDKNIVYETINLASANLHESIVPLFSEKLGELNFHRKEKTKNSIASGVKPWGTGVDVTNRTQNTVVQKSDLSLLFEELRRRSETKSCVLVFDNFEQVENSDIIVKQIASILVLTDDDQLSKHKVRVMIVGVPNNIKSIIIKNSNASTLSNRVAELPEVARLTKDQSVELLRRGLEEKLGLANKLGDHLYKDLIWFSDRIAQHLHELGLAVSRRAIANERVIDNDVLKSAVQDWLDESLSADCAVIESKMNSRETKVGRKNQALFALGQCELEEFKYIDIEKIISRNFNVSKVKLNVSQILSGFSAGDNPIISKAHKDRYAYRFVSPKYRMAIRSMLLKRGDLVEKNHKQS